jgi:methionine biosynthesis protein MetW
MLAPAKEQPQRLAARVDHLLIAEMVTRGARVLDVGSGDGELLQLLVEQHAVDGRGIEISRDGVNHCVARGLSVIQGDADYELDNYPDDAFDFAILSSTIQATERPHHVLAQLLRIARHSIVSFPNFGHWRVRLEVALRGRMPVTKTLPETWYGTPNIHLCSIEDFRGLCKVLDARIERRVALNAAGSRIGLGVPDVLQNLLASQAVFLLTRGQNRR